MYRVDAWTAAGSALSLVVKQYRTDVGPADARARVEFDALRHLRRHDAPVPEPLLLDTAGTFLGAPVLVTRHVSGTQMTTSPDGIACARALAQTLVRIHSVPCGEAERRFLRDANREYVWFMEAGAIPDWEAQCHQEIRDSIAHIPRDKRGDHHDNRA